jgi:hypothetical protein
MTVVLLARCGFPDTDPHDAHVDYVGNADKCGGYHLADRRSNPAREAASRIDAKQGYHFLQAGGFARSGLK